MVLRCNRRYNLLKPVTDSVRDFKYYYFYAKPINEATKKEVAELNSEGEVMKSLFPLSWSNEHFDLESTEYAYHPSELTKREAQTVEVLVGSMGGEVYLDYQENSL